MLHKENPIINIINPPNLKITRRVFNYLKIVLISENKKLIYLLELFYL